MPSFFCLHPSVGIEESREVGMESCVGVSARGTTRDVPTRGLRTLARPGNAARSWRGETRGVCEVSGVREDWRSQRSPQGLA